MTRPRGTHERVNGPWHWDDHSEIYMVRGDKEAGSVYHHFYIPDVLNGLDARLDAAVALLLRFLHDHEESPTPKTEYLLSGHACACAKCKDARAFMAT